MFLSTCTAHSLFIDLVPILLGIGLYLIPFWLSGLFRLVGRRAILCLLLVCPPFKSIGFAVGRPLAFFSFFFFIFFFFCAYHSLIAVCAFDASWSLFFLVAAIFAVSFFV